MAKDHPAIIHRTRQEQAAATSPSGAPQPQWEGAQEEVAGVIVVNSAGKVTAVSGARVDHRNVRFGPFQCRIGQNLFDILPSTAADFLAHAVRDVLNGSKQRRAFECTIGAGAGWKRYRFELTPIRSRAASAATIVCLDITSRFLDGHRFRAQIVALDEVAQSVFITDAAGIIVWANRAFSCFTEYLPSEYLGQHVSAICSPRYDHTFWAAVAERVRQGHPWQGDLTLRSRSGRLLLVDQSVVGVPEPSGDSAALVVRLSDSDATREAESRLIYLAQHDALTGLPNHLLFHNRVAQATEWASRARHGAALLVLNVDGIEAVKERMGKSVADVLLVGVARRLETVAGGSDSIARLDEKQFGLLLEAAATRDRAADVARRILDSLREPVQAVDELFHLGAQIGISMYPGDGGGAEELIRSARIAAAMEKPTSRHSFRFYHPEHGERMRDWIHMAHDLRLALDNGELRVAYQPQIRISTGNIVAAEALLRWPGKQRRDQPAGPIIAIAEECGLIIQVGNWVTRQVVECTNRWTSSKLPPIRFSINVSPLQLLDDQFAGKLLDQVRDLGCRPEEIQIELTENVLLQPTERLTAEFRRLRDAGISLVLDDFGTGYNSLTHLRHYPVENLKIDQSFVRGIGRTRSDEKILVAMISLAHGLGITVTAEGVETREQHEFLLAHECDFAQGFLYSPAVPEVDLVNLFGVKSSD